MSYEVCLFKLARVTANLYNDRCCARASTHLWSSANRNLEGTVPGAINFLSNPSIFTIVAPAAAALRG